MEAVGENLRNILESFIYPVVDELEDPARGEPFLEKSPQAVLFGPESPLDSMALVTFVVALEDRIEAQTGSRVTLASEKAMSRQSSPFRSLGALAEYVAELLGEVRHG